MHSYSPPIRATFPAHLIVKSDYGSEYKVKALNGLVEELKTLALVVLLRAYRRLLFEYPSYLYCCVLLDPIVTGKSSVLQGVTKLDRVKC
jgi:hypothetical protein